METADIRALEREAEAGEEAVPCVACGGTRFEVLLTPEQVEAEHRWLRRFYRRRVTGDESDLEDRVDFTQSTPTNIVRCLACGTLLRDPRPTPDALCALYARDTYAREALEALAANQSSFFARKADDVAKILPAGARVLEVGPFVGGFLAAARSRGWRATGVDVGSETVAFMREKGFDVIEGDVLDVDLPEKAWDAVFIWNTFDQLGDPARVLRKCRDLLRPDGLLVLRVPNGDFETACLRLRSDYDGTPRAAHVRRAQAYNNFVTFPYLTGYTPEALAHLVERHGFRAERLAGDTILTLADAQTLPCAVAEEARYKRAVMRAPHHFERATGRRYAPWLDFHARRVP
jgi:SAM-dependent methyltransferase